MLNSFGYEKKVIARKQHLTVETAEVYLEYNVDVCVLLRHVGNLLENLF